MTRTRTIGIGEKGFLVSCLRERLSNFKFAKGAPETLQTIIEREAWKEFQLDNGVRGKHDTFESFVTALPLEGLGTTIRRLRNICRDEPAALDALDSVCQRGKGGQENNNNASKTNDDNIQVRFKEKAPTGTSKEAALRRLRKDRPDLHKQVIDKKMSAHKAMVEAGFRKKTISISITDPESAAKAILKHADGGFMCDLFLNYINGLDIDALEFFKAAVNETLK